MLRRVGNWINIFHTKILIGQLDKNNKYIILASKINWSKLEKLLAVEYSLTKGAAALPIRLMVGLHILKYLDNLSDEKVCERWKTDHYYQAFTGNTHVIDSLPCDPSSMTVFRKRIGEKGVKAIFDESIAVFGPRLAKILKEDLIIDSTVQEKYTAFPTDIKLAIDVIQQIWRTCDKNNIKLRSKHKTEVKKLRKQAAFNKSNRRNEVKTSVLGKLRDIGLNLLKEMTRKLPIEVTTSDIFISQYNNYFKALTQQKDDKNKIYSIFEPQIYCICKGKTNVKYEFGTKVSILRTLSGVILSAISFEENLHDSKTIQPHLNDLTSRNLLLPNNIVGDAGYRGRKYYGDTTVVTPIKNIAKLPSEDLKLHVKRMNKRSSIEQTISHMKNEFRLGRNELRGIIGDKINILLCATGSNFTKFVRLEKQKTINSLLNNKKTKKIKKRSNLKV